MKGRSANRKAKRRQSRTLQFGAVPSDEERYRLVIEAVAEGIYEWSVGDSNQHLELSPKLLDMFGFAPDELTSASWMERVHPEDRAQYRDATVTYFKGKTAHFSCEYRILNKANEWRWVSDRGSGIRDQNGRVIRLIGAITDITEAKNREMLLKESLQQQSTTAEVLKAISHSDFDLQHVLDTLVESATRLCEADHAWLFQRHGDHFRWVASFGHATEIHKRIGEFFASHEVRPDRGSVTGRAALEGRVVHILDVLADPEYTYGAAQQIGGYRAALGIPLLRAGVVIGVIFVAKVVPGPFTQKQIDLVSIFASQAVIAIENARLLNELRQRTDDLTESLEQQTATSEVLRVISTSPTNVQPVFDTIAESAVRLCDGQFSFVVRFDGNVMDFASSCGLSAEGLDAFHPILPMPASEETAAGRAIVRRAVVEIPNVEADPSYGATGQDLAKAVTYRSIAAVPLLHEDNPIGAIAVARANAGPFPKRQIALLQAFADQAVIAIGNVHLFDEVQTRTRDLSEALQQQTATADVLKVISRSTFDLQTVLDTLIESATRLCAVDQGVIFLRDGDLLRLRASFGFTPEAVEWARTHPMLPNRGSATGRVALEGKPVHIHDVLADPEYSISDYQRTFGYRTVLSVPMLREGTTIGVFAMTRDVVNPFTEKQIDLVTTFADQAVIAIENVRLFEEVQKRTEELSEALEQQTATSEVLKVISSSPGELKPVFEAILDNATDICEASFGNLALWENGAFRRVALFNAPPAYAEAHQRDPLISRQSAINLYLAAETKEVVHVADVAADGRGDGIIRLGGARTLLVVPMLKDNELVGAITIYRQEVRPFTDKQIELVKNFAAQAVIAIENTRLLSELRQRTGDLTESLEQQTATSEVLKVISSSPGELDPAFNAMLENATRICEAKFGFLWLFDGQKFRLGAAGELVEKEFASFARENPPKLDRQSLAGRAVLEKCTVHIHDVLEDVDYQWQGDEGARVGNFRTVLGVPLMREETPLGAFSLARTEVRPFTDKQIDLVTNFAAQAVIAIENARLLNELRQRTDDLTQSLEDLQTAQDRLVQTQKLASLGQLTAGIAHEIKNPLNFVNNFSSLSAELLDELQDALQGLPIDGKTRSEIDELTETLRANLDKIEQHGKRADSIVKNMLLHSREGSGEHRPVDINAVVEESLNLAYHGARAEKQDFNITLERSFDPAAGEVDVFPQEITRMLLNLIANGFYAATKRKAEAADGGYEPTLKASTKSFGDRVEITIRDNGTGIPPEVREKVFNPFFTTKPPGEGTGLGLSLSHDIIVKQHAGSIEVDTEPGEFTEFKIILPRAAATMPKPGAGRESSRSCRRR